MGTPLAIFDLDETVRGTGGALYPRAHEVSIKPGAIEMLMASRQAGYLLVGATNQGGVSKGEVSCRRSRAGDYPDQELLGRRVSTPCSTAPTTPLRWPLLRLQKAVARLGA